MTDAKKKPKKGEYASVRRVVHGDYRDKDRDEGVVVGEPKNNQGYYDILSPYEPNKPFQGHTDDAEVIPEEILSPTEQRFKDDVNKQLSGDQ